jgi:uncharacterized membrane protein YgcG
MTRFSPLLRTLCALFVALLGFLPVAHAQIDLKPVPAHEGFLSDTAGFLSPAERSKLSERLLALSREKGAQLGIVIVDSTEPETIEDFAQRVFTTWKLGRTGIDDGVLFVLAVNHPTRRMRIQVGYGLEGEIPDAVAKRMLAEQVRPALDASGPVAAVNVAADVLLERMWKSEVAPKARAPGPQALSTADAGERLIMGAAAHIAFLACAGALLTLRVAMGYRYALVWLVGLLAFPLYAWVANDPALAAGAAIWPTIALVFQIRYVKSMRARAQSQAQQHVARKRSAARRQGRNPSAIKASAQQTLASGPPPGLLGALPYVAALYALTVVVATLGPSAMALASRGDQALKPCCGNSPK